MIATQLISDTVIPLRTSDTGAMALSFMSDYYVRHLPIVNDTQLLGILSEEDVLDNDALEAVGSYTLRIPPAVHVTPDDHLFEVLAFMAEHQLSVVPVVRANGDYLGLITEHDLMQHHARSFSFAEPGSILVLELAKQDYTLSDIARIIEGERGAVLGVYITTHEDDPMSVCVTVKISLQDLTYVRASLERFGFKVRGAFQEQEYFNDLQDNYNALINYLSI